MNEFEQIAREEGTDKVTTHNYQNIYPVHLDYLRLAKFTLFEVGVRGGSSMRLWRRYFPGSDVHGFDHGKKFNVDGNAPGVHLIDVRDPGFAALVDTLPRPLVVVDDGGHWEEQQRAAFDILWPRLLSGGWYFIEDLHAALYPDRVKRNSDYTRRLAGQMRSLLHGADKEEIAEIHAYHEICLLRKR